MVVGSDEECENFIYKTVDLKLTEVILLERFSLKLML